MSFHSVHMKHIKSGGWFKQEGMVRGGICISPHTDYNELNVSIKHEDLYGNTLYTSGQIRYALESCNYVAAEAAKMVGCSWQTIIYRAGKMGINIKRKPNRSDAKYSDNDIITSLIENDYNGKATARQLGCSANTINKRAKKLGLPIIGRKGRRPWKNVTG